MQPAVVGAEQSDDSVDVGRPPVDEQPDEDRLWLRGEDAADGIVSCPACGASNAEARMLCAECGANLDTGEVPGQADVVRPGPVVDVVGDVQIDERAEGPRTAMIVATIVILGAIIGIGIGIWAVRAGQPDDDPSPEAPAGSLDGEPDTLSVTRVGASSTLPGGAGIDPRLLVDGDVATSWSHDPGTEESTEVDLAFGLDQQSWVTHVLVANGAQEDPATFAASERVRTLTVIVDDRAVAEVAIGDLDGFQQAQLPEPVLTDTVRFVIAEVYEGATSDEVSLSEIAFRGFTAADATIEQSGEGG